MKIKGNKIYAVWLGERLVAVGTAAEVCDALCITPATLAYYCSPSARRREQDEGRAVRVVGFEPEPLEGQLDDYLAAQLAVYEPGTLMTDEAAAEYCRGVVSGLQLARNYLRAWAAAMKEWESDEVR